MVLNLHHLIVIARSFAFILFELSFPNVVNLLEKHRAFSLRKLNLLTLIDIGVGSKSKLRATL